MISFAKIAFVVYFLFSSLSLIRRHVAGESDQGVCPYSGGVADDEPMDQKYQEPPSLSDSHPKNKPIDEEDFQSRHPDIKIHSDKEIDHPVLGKMKLVTIPVPNKQTGEQFTTGYMLVNEDKSTKESEDFLSEDDMPPERESWRSEASTSAAFEEDSSTDDLWRGSYHASTMNFTQRNSTGNLRTVVSQRPMMKEDESEIFPAPQQSPSTKTCCTCEDPPEKKCLRERENCGCGASEARRKDGDVTCSWRCCCC